MPITYTIDRERGIIRTKCFGQVTLEEVVDHFRTLERDPKRPERLAVFLDLSEADSLPETNQLYSVVEALRQIRGHVHFDACAILASRDALFGMMRMFEVFAEDVFRVTGTFRTAGEAEAWLGSQRSRPEQLADEGELDGGPEG